MSAQPWWRRQAKELIWRLRGAFVSNPPMPARVDSVVFVCKGNICRSPFAALLAERALAEQGRTAPLIRSAGLAPSQAGESPADAVAAAAAHGLSLAMHRPVALTDELMAGDALIVVMDAAQLTEVRRRWPQASARTVLLALFPAEGAAALPPSDRVNIVDPFGHGRAAFDACYTRLDGAVRDLLRHLPLTADRTSAARE
jgi:protein-tyrosine phosphatase